MQSKRIDKIKKWYKQYNFKRKCKDIDNSWWLFGGACFGGYPPSFYLTHTPEEIERIKKEDIEKTKEILKQMKNLT